MKYFMFKPRFRQLIVCGSKRQTIRGTRAHPPRPGEEISLRVWEGRPYGSPQVLIGTATFIGAKPIEVTYDGGIRVKLDGAVLERELLEVFARADGFIDSREMDLFWQENKGYPFEGAVYGWAGFKPAGEGVAS